MSGESEVAWARRTYDPCDCGVHLCGSDDEENRVFTIANFPTGSDADARFLWDRLRAECEVEKEAGDFLVDLAVAEGLERDFWCSRQMLPRLEKIASEKEPTHDQ